VRRLYLSYNPLRSFPSQCAYINLTYLELVSCSLSRLLPDSFSSTVPSLQVLNLTGNFLEDLQGLAGLKHLRRLKMTENRVASVEAVVSCITQLPHLYCLDLRCVRGPPGAHI
jgi:Leucine-rich repeat (LRR) protein